MAMRGFSEQDKDTKSENLNKAFASIGFPAAPSTEETAASVTPAIEKPSEKPKKIPVVKKARKRKTQKNDAPVYHNPVVELAKNANSLATIGMLHVLESLVGPEGNYVNYSVLENSIGIARQNIKPRIDHLESLGAIVVQGTNYDRRGKFIIINGQAKRHDSATAMPTRIMRPGATLQEVQKRDQAELFFWCFIAVKREPEAITVPLVTLLLEFAQKYDNINAAALILQNMPNVTKNPFYYFQKVIATWSAAEPSYIKRAEEIEEARNRIFLTIGEEILPIEWERAAQTLRLAYGLNPPNEIQRTYKTRMEKYTRNIFTKV